MSSIHQLLKQYFGYDAFRPLQEDIINSVLQGKDTLALLPTGGGKSLCYQVPALAKEGICIVVSPLIALMLDQVDNLKKKKIKATAIWSGMTKKEVDTALDNCVYGDQKFLYVSPERLLTDIFRERLKKMKVNLLAVDEAHCVSQWGYDFRPPYLQIAEIRKFLPAVPLLAVTATATLPVCDDIQEKLLFAEKNIFRASFARNNISFVVRNAEDKESKLLEIISKISGSGIIYVRNRKKTKEIAQLLSKHHLSADFYHAGLENAERSKKQQSWVKGKTRIIVCTNAFGMGIDKPDVRFVIHWDVPESPEAYYQEAGRAGRDGKQSYAVLLFHGGDIASLQSFLFYQYPEIEFVKKIYHALGNYLQLANGAGKNEAFDFDLIDFCTKYKLNATQTTQAFKIMQQNNYIYFGDALQRVATLKIVVDNETLYRYQVENKQWDTFIKMLLRLTPGVFDDFVPVYEKEVAYHLSIPPAKFIEQIKLLQKQGIVQYNPVKTSAQIIFTTEKLPFENLQFDTTLLKKLKKGTEERLTAMQNYVQNKNLCRMQVLLEYFGETSQRCGYCDICIERKKLGITEHEYDDIYAWVKQKLLAQPESPETIYKHATIRKEKLLEAVQFMKDNKIIEHTKENLLVWKG